MFKILQRLILEVYGNNVEYFGYSAPNIKLRLLTTNDCYYEKKMHADI